MNADTKQKLHNALSAKLAEFHEQGMRHYTPADLIPVIEGVVDGARNIADEDEVNIAAANEILSLRKEVEQAKHDRNKAAMQERQKYLPVMEAQRKVLVQAAEALAYRPCQCEIYEHCILCKAKDAIKALLEKKV